MLRAVTSQLQVCDGRYPLCPLNELLGHNTEGHSSMGWLRDGKPLGIGSWKTMENLSKLLEVLYAMLGSLVI